MYIDEQLPISEYGYFLWRDHRGRECRVVGFYMWQVGGFFWVLQFPPPIELTATI
jgi:hypothetical protein